VVSGSAEQKHPGVEIQPRPHCGVSRVTTHRKSGPPLSLGGVGKVFPLLGTVSGHVFLAYIPSPVTKPLLEAELADRAARGVSVFEAEIGELIARVRRQPN